MTEHPILFSGAMVRAILEGRKTVTRRVCKPQPSAHAHTTSADGNSMSAWWETGKGINRCPYGQHGDRLWVRESTEADYDTHDAVVLARYCADKAPVLITDCADPAFNGSVAHWNYPRDVRPSIHMKREQARILLEITAVRVERLQDISYESARAEGVLNHPDIESGKVEGSILTSKALFECLWCDTYGDDSWFANPWVWVVEFKRVMP